MHKALMRHLFFRAPPALLSRRLINTKKISPAEAAFREKQEKLRSTNSTQNWWKRYNKTYKGAEAENVWQMAGGLSLAIIFVGIPVAYALTTNFVKKRNERLSAENRAQGEEIQRMLLTKKLKRINEIRKEQGLVEIHKNIEK